MPVRIEIPVGTRFGRLVVASEEPQRKNSRILLCLCDCGGKKVAALNHLRDGHTTSCGCVQKQSVTTHGRSKTKVYRVWLQAKSRCDDPSHRRFPDYGGRGITFCDDWQSFDNFYRDMGEPPEGMSLDRRDNNKGYSKENCRWATRKEQMRNMRGNVLLECDGKIMSIVEWAEKANVNYHTFRERVLRGWSVPEACTPVVRKDKVSTCQLE